MRAHDDTTGRPLRLGAAPCADAGCPACCPRDSRPARPAWPQHIGPLRPGPVIRAGPARAGKRCIDEVERSGLTGRGGAAFPTARKLAAVAAGHAPVVVANGTEGEPASAKDKVLLARSPHLVLDGAVLAAEITGARQAVIVVHPSVREIIDEAVAERRRARIDHVPIGCGDRRRPVRRRGSQRGGALDR